MSVETESKTSNPTATKFTDAPPEYEAFENLLTKLVQVPKSDLDKARESQKP